VRKIYRPDTEKKYDYTKKGGKNPKLSYKIIAINVMFFDLVTFL